jgi:hypothetical protein
MTGTNLPQKRSERGASLVLLVGIIGLAFIVTVAGFLVAASNGQDTARLASAKVDIATREDALMREILQYTATGLLPGTNGVTGAPATWTTTMTNAVNQLHATTYADPVELAAITGLSGLISANTGDTGGTSLGIFQGYSQEVPFGGTSPLGTLANLDPSYNSAVEPPLMLWSNPNSTLSTATALTTPQEFFLGSLYPAGVTASVTKLSLSNRWGQIIYPNVRFGYKQPGNLFIARRVWWRIPVVYQTAQQTVEDQATVMRYPSATANYILSVYEIPSQLPISGNANLQIGLNSDGTAWGGGVTVAGSIYGGLIQLSPGTYTGVSSRQQVNVVSGATVGGATYTTSTNNLFDQPGTRETMSLTQIPGGAAPVSVAGNDGKVLIVPVMPGSQFYMSVATPTHWDLYARPYYRCRIRITISGTNSTIIYSPTQTPQINTAAGAITVNVNYLQDTSSLPDQLLGFLDSTTTAAPGSPYSQTSYADGLANARLPAYMNYTSTGAGDRNLLVIDVPTMVSTLGSGTPAQDSTQLYSIYIGSNPTTEPATPSTTSDPGVAITNTNDLHLFTSGLSIVSNQTLYLIDSFNQVNLTGGTLPPPTSIYAPQVRYGMSGATAPVALIGQISLDPAATPTPGSAATPVPANPLTLLNGSGTSIPTSSITANFSEITDPTLIPPIPRMTLMFTIEKMRTN